MNAEMMKRYGLIPKNALVQVINNVQSSTNVQMPPNSPAQSTRNQTPSVRSIEMLKRYGLMPQNPPSKFIFRFSPKLFSPRLQPEDCNACANYGCPSRNRVHCDRDVNLPALYTHILPERSVTYLRRTTTAQNPPDTCATPASHGCLRFPGIRGGCRPSPAPRQIGGCSRSDGHPSRRRSRAV